MTFVKTKIELSKLQYGDILEVLLSEGEPLDNVPRNATDQGCNHDPRVPSHHGILPRDRQ